MRKFLLALAIGFLALTGSYLFLESQFHSFKQCVAQHGTYNPEDYRNQSAQEREAGLKAGIIYVEATCTGYFLNAHDGVLTGIATVLLSLVTGGLVSVGYQQYATTRAQLRAYVFPASCGMWDPGAPNGVPPPPPIPLLNFPNNPPAPVPTPTFRPRSRIVVKNTGATPAYSVRHWSHLVLCAVSGHAAFRPPDDISELVATSIGPEGTLSVERDYEGVLTQAEVQVLAQNPSTMMLMAYGKVTYRDAFGRERVTTYKVAWAGNYPPPHTVELINVAGGDTAT